MASLGGLNGALGILHQVYPQARVTSGYRDPSSALGQENPRSYHNIGQAFDVAPIPGVSFGDYVNNLKSHGLNVVESLDEASHPAFDTTGPNWHIAFASQPQAVQQHVQQSVQPGAPPVARPSLASMMNAQQPVNAGQAPDQVPAPSLGALASSMPQGNIPQPSKFTAGNVLGVLGDALSAYGGRQPTFGPFLQQEKILGQQQAFEREKFQQQLQMQLFAMTHPAEFMQANAFHNMPASAQRNYLSFQDATHPLYTTVNGSQVLQKRVQTPPPEAVAHLRGALSAGADPSSESAQFDAIFGPGAAAEALGAQ